MLALSLALIALALIGHSVFWIGLVNRTHGTGWPRVAVKGVSLVHYLIMAGIAFFIARHFARTAESASWRLGEYPPLDWATVYVLLAAAFGAFRLVEWLYLRWQRRKLPPGVRSGSAHTVDLCQLLGAAPTSSPRTRLFCRLPFNQLWQLHVAEFDVTIAELPSALDGMSICHLSDLHFSPRIDRGYYDEVVRLTNDLQADLIALTGDICDKGHLIDWIPHTLGRIDAPLGKLYVLGNHDLRTRDVARLRTEMHNAGFVDLGGRLETVADGKIIAAGNERPWFRKSAPQIDGLPSGPLKLLLSHSPDQFGWARRHGFDLMLAGHTHGGQIRFPVLGAVICPSRHGTRYACGFFPSKTTLLHVSRGTSSLFPYRMNCRPEIVKLTLHTG